MQTDAVELIALGTAPALVQPTEGATYDPALNKKELQQVVLLSTRLVGGKKRFTNSVCDAIR